MNHDEYRSNGQAVSDLVRTIAPRGCSVATYSVLLGAVRGAINITAVRSDGHVHRDDVLKILRTAVGGSSVMSADERAELAYTARVLDMNLKALASLNDSTAREFIDHCKDARHAIDRLLGGAR